MNKTKYMGSRSIREQPFCWQEKKILRLLKEKFKQMERAKILLLYTTLTWIDNDFNGKDINYFTKTIASYSGLSINWIPQALRKLEQLGIISIIKKTDSKKRSIGQTIIFTPESVKDIKVEEVTDCRKYPSKPNVANPSIGQSGALEQSLNKKKEKGLLRNPGIQGKSSKPEKSNINKEAEQREPEESELGVKEGEDYKVIKGVPPQEIQEVMGIFYKTINPMINFANKTQRGAVDKLIKRFGFENVCAFAMFACKIHGRKYAPVITTPCQLLDKLSSLIAFKEREESGEGQAFSLQDREAIKRFINRK